MKLYLDVYLVFTTLLVLSCTPKTEKRAAQDDVIKTVEQAALESDKIVTKYELIQGECSIAWKTISTKKDNSLDVQLRNQTDCKLPFDQVANLHRKVISTVLREYPASVIKFIFTGGLKTIQPDGSWNLALSNAAEASADYQDFRKNYPKNKKDVHDIFIDLVIQTQAHAPFKQMLAKQGLNFELSDVEKIFNSKNAKGDLVMNDVSTIWWKPL